MSNIFGKITPLTDDEYAYYRDVGNFSLTAEDMRKIDERAERISSCAISDIICRKPKRTLKDFNNKSEYTYYLTSLYTYADYYHNV